MGAHSINARLDRLEHELHRMTGSDERAQWKELTELFIDADPEHREVVSKLASYGGTANLARLLRLDGDDPVYGSLVAQLRRDLGRFCCVKRLRVPESEIVWVRVSAERPDRLMIVPMGEAGPSGERFLQLFGVNDEPQ